MPGVRTRPLVTPLASIGRADLASAGAKAANLGELLQAGFLVPEGFVIRSAAFDRTGRLTEAGRHELEAALAALGDVELAVRSSAIAEDMPDASFAGQYESVLGVRGLPALLSAVEQCWGSSRSARVRAYQAAKRIEVEPMAVLVQRLVPADAAGVAFTANPVSGDRNETIVNAVRGLAERLVSGLAAPDEWSVRDSHAHCNAAPEQAIGAAQALRVAELGRRVEAHFGAPQDVEWAFAEDQLFLLQARPITALPPIAVAPQREMLEVPAGYWERGAGHFPEPLSPAFRWRLSYLTEISREQMAELGLPIEEIAVREIGGWVYARKEPLAESELRSRLRASAFAKDPTFASRRAGELAETWYREWRPAVTARIGELQTVDLAALDDARLAEHLAAVIEFNKQGWRQHFELILAGLLLPSELILFCERELGWKEAEALEILYGTSSMTTEPAHHLADLAERARRKPEIEGLLRSGAATVASMHSLNPEFADALAAYLRSYGCRVLRMDPSEKTIAELPELVIGLIRDQLERSYDPTAEAEAHRERREAALARARATLASRALPVRTVFEALVVGAQRAYPIREDNQFFLVSAPIALLRYALLEVGHRLGLRGQIDRAEDVFFLELEELRAALQTGQGRTALIERRKGELAWVKAHPGPGCYGERPARPPSLDGLPEATRRLLEFLSWVFDRAEAQLESARRQTGDALQLTGVAGSAGRYRGPACVIRNEAEFRKIRAGDVLVCPTTSPVWSVIFPSVGALVTDTGGILAHAALIAREYRVPAVLATGNATEILHDGQVVTVDGTAGIVSIDI